MGRPQHPLPFHCCDDRVEHECVVLGVVSEVPSLVRLSLAFLFFFFHPLERKILWICFSVCVCVCVLLGGNEKHKRRHLEK